MNYELKNIDNIEFFSTEKPRSIKLRQLSYTNVINKWVFNIPVSTENVVEENIANKNVVNNFNIEDQQKVKLPVSIGNLENQIMIIDSTWSTFQSIKRRVLAISDDMYQNIINNVSKVFSKDDTSAENINNQINDDEIKQAVKDAFDQIDFNVPVTDDVVITPEEVNDTVSDVNNEVDFSYENSNVKIPDIDEFDSNIEEANEDVDVSNKNNDNSFFNFEDISFDKIESDSVSSESEKEKGIDYGQDDNIAVDSDNLDNIISEVKELKAQKDEQDKKTEDAINLAMKKEEEKEKIKIDFEKYKTTMKEELDRSKKEEEENLEKARKAEEFTAALSDIMSNNNSLSNNFIPEN